jgi:hypothetical protein
MRPSGEEAKLRHTVSAFLSLSRFFFLFCSDHLMILALASFISCYQTERDRWNGFVRPPCGDLWRPTVTIFFRDPLHLGFCCVHY